MSTDDDDESAATATHAHARTHKHILVIIAILFSSLDIYLFINYHGNDMDSARMAHQRTELGLRTK